MSATISSSSELGVIATVRRGLQLSPAMVHGIRFTLLLAVVATSGRVVVPVIIQQVTDNVIFSETPAGGVGWLVLAGVGMVALSWFSSAAVNIRLFRSSETGLAQLRTRTFRHVHDLSVLTQSAERRGALVSRVTSDVDTISRFVQFGGLQLVLSSTQMALATVAMLVYSPLLAAVVWLCFLPMFLLAPRAQRIISRAYSHVRERTGEMLTAISESVVGAETIRAYGAQYRSQRRVDRAIDVHRAASYRAQAFAGLAFSAGTLLSGVALSAIVVVGVFLGLAGDITIGRLLAFLFLVQLFTGPLQMATELLNELQNAVAGWRRVIAVLETPLEVTDPGQPEGADGTGSPATAMSPESAPRAASPARDGRRRGADVTFSGVRYSYPGGPEVLHGVDLEIASGTSVAIVGETGSGKTTLAKLLARLMDPMSGRVLLDGVDLRELRLADLRRRVVLVPQEGFLFDATLGENIGYGVHAHTDAQIEEAVRALGLDDWIEALPTGLQTRVGQRGESLSAGERQLIALARAYLADGDVLILDEATSAVDPATEVRIVDALERLAAGRTSVAIAHRLSTAEAADLVVVVDAGNVVEVGSHGDLLRRGGHYARMHATWVAGTS